MGTLSLSRRLPLPCWRWSQGLAHVNLEKPQWVRKYSTSARLIKNPGPKIFENSAGATLYQSQKQKKLCHEMPDFDRELSCEVKNQVFRRCPIVKLAGNVYAYPTISSSGRDMPRASTYRQSEEL